MTGLWGVTPRQSVEAECAVRGRAAVIAGCVGILQQDQPADVQLLRALGGPAADQILAGREGGPSGYWPRVWAARGLLHVWDDTATTNAATTALIHATADESWRVREMVAKVVARHHIGDALDAVAALRDDPVARVRQAAVRAVEIVTAAGA